MTDTAANAPATVPERGSKLARVAFIAAIIAVLAIPAMTAGRYAGLWSPVNALPSLLAFLITFFASILAVVLGLIGVLRRKDRPWSASPVQRSLIALGLGLVIVATIGTFIAGGAKYPPIHDITTDITNPPVYVALQIERDAMKAPNTTAYDPAVGEKQKQGFPDLGPKILPVPTGEAFNKALEAAKAMGWRIAAAEPAEGRIEGVDTTFWAGYIDDIVIRITAIDEGQSRIDVRSVSRVGGGDAGTNGKRIQKYLATLN
jgi:hypothetical protein